MQTKIFVGYRLLFELDREDIHPLITIPHEGKEYVGSYLPHTPSSIQEVRKISLQIKEALQAKVDIHLESLPLFVIGQALLG